jgi:hypothetical protein
MRQSIKELIMKNARLGIILVAMTVMGLFGASMAYADTLVLGGAYPTFSYSYNNINGHSGTGGGSGSIDPSTLNGIALPWVFCTQIEVDISVPGTFDTTVSNSTSIANADKVAYLLQSYAHVGMSSLEMTTLQAAIWHEIYGDKFTPISGYNSALYGTYIAAALTGNGDVSKFAWLSPAIGTTQYQALVTQVPEPSLILLLGIGFGAVSLTAFRKKN